MACILLEYRYKEFRMGASHRFSRSIFIFIFVSVVLLVNYAIMPTPSSAADGRINLIPWVNGHGAVAVYCIDKNGGTRSFTGGGIKVLNSSGQQLLFAAEKLIIAAQVQADKTHSAVLILVQGMYSLSALPNGYFQLNSVPDKEGKTSIGKWYGCTPIGPGPDAPPALPAPNVPTVSSCVPVPPICNESDYDACLNANGGNPDCDGNPSNNGAYCDRPPAPGSCPLT
jgi:hypothetical protein